MLPLCYADSLTAQWLIMRIVSEILKFGLLVVKKDYELVFYKIWSYQVNPGDENYFKVLQLGLEHRPCGQEVDGLGEAVVDDGGRVGDVAEGDGHVVGSAMLVPETSVAGHLSTRDFFAVLLSTILDGFNELIKLFLHCPAVN